MRGLLIKGMGAREVEANGLEDYYRLMEVEIIDIVTRKINGKYYDIICDDEGLLKDKPIPTVFDTNREPMIVGNIIIAGLADEDGNMTDLTDEDIVAINASLGIVRFNNGTKHLCVLDVEY